MPITRLAIRNFRCIQNMDLNLSPFTVVIGPNGVGKTTFLRAFDVLARSARGELKQAFKEFGGFYASRCWNSKDTDMAFSLAVEHGGIQYKYDLVLEEEGNAYYVATEVLHRNSPPKGHSAYVLPDEFDPNTPTPAVRSLSGIVLRVAEHAGQCVLDDKVKQIRFEKRTEGSLCSLAERNTDLKAMQTSLCNTSTWSANELPLEALRVPQQLQPEETLSPKGDNLLSVLYTLKTQQRDRYQELIESVQAAFLDLESIELPLVGKGYASLNWYQSRVDKPLDARQLSDGTLRLLWWVTLLHTLPDDSIVLIDEPEISMHPQWLMFLAGLFRQMSARMQIIVATHSSQLIRWVEPSELLVGDMEDGVSTFRRGDEMNLDEWLKDYTLDQLWLMGEIGGRQ